MCFENCQKEYYFFKALFSALCGIQKFCKLNMVLCEFPGCIFKFLCYLKVVVVRQVLAWFSDFITCKTVVRSITSVVFHDYHSSSSLIVVLKYNPLQYCKCICIVWHLTIVIGQYCSHDSFNSCAFIVVANVCTLIDLIDWLIVRTTVFVQLIDWWFAHPYLCHWLFHNSHTYFFLIDLKNRGRCFAL